MESLGEEYAAWRERWMKRMDHRGYWVGQPDHICFAWNEPDISIWNPVTERDEGGWRFVPPKLCLKNRQTAGAEPVRVQAQPKSRGPLKPSDHVLFSELEGELLVGDLKAKESFVLDEVGADMWRALVKHGNLAEAANALLKDYRVDEATLRADLCTFVDDLLSRGLLKNAG
jgi:hypothetical protein